MQINVRAHGIRNTNQILHGDQTKLRKNSYSVDHTTCPDRERENFIRHSNMNKNHTMQRSHEWQVARKGITPIELATLKKQNKLTQKMQ